MMSAIASVLSDVGRPPVVPSATHTVMFRVPVRAGEVPDPYGTGRDLWDETHVRLPCSPHSLYPSREGGGEEPRLLQRWSLIQKALLREFHDFSDLEQAIKCYNVRFKDKWDFSGLRYYIEEVLSEEESHHLLSETIPSLARLALRLPELVRQPLPLLRQHVVHSVSLSQLQIASLLANAFFCTFPRRNSGRQRDGHAAHFPEINMNRLFIGRTGGGISGRRAEKLMCVLHYFHRVLARAPTGVVTFTRQYLSDGQLPRWSDCHEPLRRLTASARGLIEEQRGLLQVDFANRLVGGGVLGDGCVQEEIRFVVDPELLVAMLLTERLEDTEALLITGPERFNQYTGYADTFRWSAKAVDATPLDRYGRRRTQLVAIDALYFSSQRADLQYQPRQLARELNKAYSGFHTGGATPAGLSDVATGNWGSGAFGGDARLKALLQLMAASAAGRDVVYLTFGDQRLSDELNRTGELLQRQSVTVSRLYQTLLQYSAVQTGRRNALQYVQDQFTEDEALLLRVLEDTDDFDMASGSEKNSQSVHDNDDNVLTHSLLPDVAEENPAGVDPPDGGPDSPELFQTPPISPSGQAISQRVGESPTDTNCELNMGVKRDTLKSGGGTEQNGQQANGTASKRLKSSHPSTADCRRHEEFLSDSNTPVQSRVDEGLVSDTSNIAHSSTHEGPKLKTSSPDQSRRHNVLQSNRTDHPRYDHVPLLPSLGARSAERNQRQTKLTSFFKQL